MNEKIRGASGIVFNVTLTASCCQKICSSAPLFHFMAFVGITGYISRHSHYGLCGEHVIQLSVWGLLFSVSTIFSYQHMLLRTKPPVLRRMWLQQISTCIPCCFCRAPQEEIVPLSSTGCQLWIICRQQHGLYFLSEFLHAYICCRYTEQPRVVSLAFETRNWIVPQFIKKLLAMHLFSSMCVSSLKISCRNEIMVLHKLDVRALWYNLKIFMLYQKRIMYHVFVYSNIVYWLLLNRSINPVAHVLEKEMIYGEYCIWT